MSRSESTLDKYTNVTDSLRSLPSADELREMLAALDNSDAKAQIEILFDENTFVELGAFTKRKFSEISVSDKTDELEGVICGYGAINDQLVYAFAQDGDRMKGAIDEMHAKKICALYDLAIKNGAPVVGIFNSAGADVYEGVSALAGYAKIMKAVSAASGVVPQIALVSGSCIGSAAAIAAMFDFVVYTKDSSFYVNAPEFAGENAEEKSLITFEAIDKYEGVSFVHRLLNYLPQNAAEGVVPLESTDNLNRMLGNIDFEGDARRLIAAIADSGIYLEVNSDFAPVASTAFTFIGGIKCGVVATSFAENEGRLTAEAAKKIAKFVDFCDAFAVPLITLVDSNGTAIVSEGKDVSFAADLAKLGLAYAKSENPKITVIVGKAIGAAYTLLGSKAIGADVTYALDSAEIGALPSENAVAFLWNGRITLDETREDIIDEWKASLASPVAAASLGEIDDIINITELRARICSALMMLAAKGTASFRRHAVLPQ